MARDKLFLDTDVVLDHLSDRQPFAVHARRLFALAELRRIEACVSALSFSHIHYLFRKGRTRAETLAQLAKLKRIVKVATVGEREIQAALDSDFADFEDAIQHFTALAEGGINVIITRNGSDYSTSQIPVMSPEEYVASRVEE